MNNIERQPLIATRASVEMKARFAALATRKGCSESRLLALMIERVLQDNSGADDGVERGDSTSDRVSLRLRAGDFGRVRLRAARRGMKPASYLSALIHAHVRSIPPLLVVELNALKLAVVSLGSVTRTLQRLQAATPERSSDVTQALTETVALVEALRRDVSAVVRQNLKSWECADA